MAAGFSRRELLRLGALAALAPAWVPGVNKRLVLVFADGGWDPTFTFDPKLGLPGFGGPEVDVRLGDKRDREEVVTLGGHPLVVNPRRRPTVTRFFERWGAEVRVFRGLELGTLAHTTARKLILTGSRTLGVPDLCARLAAASPGVGISLADFSGQGQPAPDGRLLRPGRNGQAEWLVSPAARAAAGAPSALTEADRAAIDGWLRARADAAVDRWADRRGAAERLDPLPEALEAAVEARRSLADVPWQAGSAPRLLDQVPRAVGLLQRGCHAVLLTTDQDWDTHAGHVRQHELWESLFSGLYALNEALEAAGLLGETVVLVCSELARTPWRNAENGKDHWTVGGALVWGGGVQGGAVGATDDRLLAQAIDPISGAPSAAGRVPTQRDLLRGLCEHLNLDPGPWLADAWPLPLR